MARIRIFIAVNIDDSVRTRVAALQAKLARTAPGVKWVEPESMHVTLLFLGEVEELDVVPICRIVKEHAEGMPPFSLTFKGIGAFPTPRHPKILWAGIPDGIDDLKRLHGLLEGPLLALGCYRREDRPYSPHLTLGRLTQEDRSEAWGTILAQHAEWYGGTSHIRDVLVMRSELIRESPVYSIVGRAKLRGSPPI